MATYTELQQKVLRRVIDAPTAVQTEVPALVNKAIRKAEQKHNYACMRASVSYTTASVRVLGAIPADFKQVRDYPYRVADDGNVVELRMAPSDRAPQRKWQTTDVGVPRIVTFGALNSEAEGNFEVFPLPDGRSGYDDGEYRIIIPYYRFLPDLSDDSDDQTNWFTLNGEEYIVYDACAEAFRINWDEKRADYYEDKAMKAIRDMRSANAAFVLGGMDLLIPFVDANQPDITE